MKKAEDGISYYRKTLRRLDDELEHRDMLVLKFLCRDHLSSTQLEKVDSGLDLFEELEMKQLLNHNNLQFLVECLKQAERVDLMKLLRWTVDDLQKAIEDNGEKLTPFRLVLHKMAEHMIASDLKQLKGIMKDSYSRKQLENADAYSLFIMMERSEDINFQNVDQLLAFLKQMDDPHPVEMLQAYKDKHCVEESPAFKSMQVQTSLDSLDQTVSVIPHSRGKFPAYKMSSCPKGRCLIINNSQFNPQRDEQFELYNPDLHPRNGSNIDLDLVKSTFKELGFCTDEHSDLTAARLIKLIRTTAENNHSTHDAFVCCILTHGQFGQVFGSDCNAISIQKILKFFQADVCPTLKGKPKIFFIQACQGPDQGQAFDYDNPSSLFVDGPSTDAPAVDQSQVTPVGIAHMAKLPLESDFFLGLATTPGHVSYRSKSKGSWYMTALCHALNEYHKQLDLVSIMTTVNRSVSRKDGPGFGQCGAAKQMPLPINTLRKLVYFC